MTDLPRFSHPTKVLQLDCSPEEKEWLNRITDLYLSKTIDKLTYLDWMEHYRETVTHALVEVTEQAQAERAL